MAATKLTLFGSVALALIHCLLGFGFYRDSQGIHMLLVVVATPVMPVTQIIIHRTDQPDVLVNSFYAHGLTSEYRPDIDFLAAQTDAAAVGDHDDLVIERIIDIWQSFVDTSRRLIDLGRTPHAQSFVRTFVVEDFDETHRSGPVAKGNLEPAAWWLLSLTSDACARDGRFASDGQA